MRPRCYWTILTPVVAIGVLSATPAWSQNGPRKVKPTGQEIAAQVKGARLDAANATQGELHGKHIKLTPVDPGQPKSLGDLEAGQTIGVMETEVAGDETSLAPGKYDLYAAKVGDKWHVYAEAQGQIIQEATRVSLSERKRGGGTKPEFHAQGYGFTSPFPRNCYYPPCPGDPDPFPVLTFYW
jgi:hypothetical protein